MHITATGNGGSIDLRLGAAGKERILRLDFARFFAYSPMKELRFFGKKIMDV